MKIATKLRSELWFAFIAAAIAICPPAVARITGYAPPPSDYDALLAVQSRVEEKSAESYYAGAGGLVSTGSNYPIDIRLLRCDENPNRLLPASNGYSNAISGYECVIDIYPAEEPAYRVGGFFYFDGLSWRYYGPLRRPELVEIDKYEQSYEPGVLKPKQGAIKYRGFTGFNSDDSPYNPILARAAKRSE